MFFLKREHTPEIRKRVILHAESTKIKPLQSGEILSPPHRRFGGGTAADLRLQGNDSVFLFPFPRLPQYK